jgi:large subunit ribosomal protein L33
MAKKSKGARVNIQEACTECGRINYTSQKNKKNNTERLEMDKYCPFCKRHTKHKETK